MTEKLAVTRLGHRGDGIVETPDGPVFIPYTLPAEIVEAETVMGHPDRRNLLRVVMPSPARIAAICPHFGICGGCALQHANDSLYRAWKTSLVADALAQAGIQLELAPLIDAHGLGRRRVVLHARFGASNTVTVGFSAARMHVIVPIDRCPILAPSLKGAIEAAREIADVFASKRKPLDIQITGTQNGIDIDIRGSGPIDHGQMSAFARLSEKRSVARITRHGELAIQRAQPAISIGSATLILPPGSFLQATQTGETVLAQLVSDHLSQAKNIADLFAGVGPFALRVAEKTRVTAIDSDAAALAALMQAAKTPGLKPIETRTRDLFRRPLVASELTAFDGLVFDPPRQGAEGQSREIAKSKVKRVVAVSCNAGTFARDARILIDGGYRLLTVTPIDQFRYAAHAEIVGTFER